MNGGKGLFQYLSGHKNAPDFDEIKTRWKEFFGGGSGPPALGEKQRSWLLVIARRAAYSHSLIPPRRGHREAKAKRPSDDRNPTK